MEKNLVDRLLELCVTTQTHQTRGLHACKLCSESVILRYAEWCGQQWLLGDAEIRVTAASGHVYAAPNLIIHYVQEHDYKPPDEFLAALAEGPRT